MLCKMDWFVILLRIYKTAKISSGVLSSVNPLSSLMMSLALLKSVSKLAKYSHPRCWAIKTCMMSEIPS